MTRKDAFLQFGAALICFSLLSFFIKTPGYMDAEYYTLSAVQIANGKGLTQPILWNFLDDPVGLPHPSHTYWMPAPSLVASVGMLLSSRPIFSTARIPFIIFAALAVPAAGWMGYRFSKRRAIAWLAAGLAVCCGYYAPYTGTVDSFYLVMAGAWVFFYVFDWILFSDGRKNMARWFFLGLASGWLHLNRADGLLWLGLAVGLWFVLLIIQKRGKLPDDRINILAIFAGYFAITGFWYYRNLTQFSSLFPPHTSRALWMTSYNELFSFPPEQLTFDYWLASGFASILHDRMNALTRNLAVFAGVQGMILFVPLWIVAFWKRRQDTLIQIALAMEVVILLIMSFVFPYSGMRGGFLHSSAALQPLFWGLAAAGAADVIQWAASKRKWNLRSAEIVLLPGIVLICGLVTIFIFRLVVIGSNPELPAWEGSFRSSENVRELIKANDLLSSTRILINNPAGYALVTGGEAVVIPDGPGISTLAVAKKFDVNYLVLEINHVTGLDALYDHPQENPMFTLIGNKEDAFLFRINQAGGDDL
ncbi:MAG: hypothetical protein WCG34_03875 [Leptolinea sp.]